MTPEVAAWAMIGAHNSLSNIGGYSAAQGVFGRNFTDSLQLHDGPDLPYWSGVGNTEKMQQQLAKKHHREFILREKINQAHNTKMAKPVRYVQKVPTTSRFERSHQTLDVPRRKVARWYGPARILALETKVSYYLGHCVWKVEEGAREPAPTRLREREREIGGARHDSTDASLDIPKI